MRLFIRAVRRLETNVYTTLASMATRDPQSFADLEGIHVLSGDGDREFLRPLERTHAINVHYAADTTYNRIKPWKPKRRGAWSYAYFLQLAASLGSDAIVAEDDIEVANWWLDRLRDASKYARGISNNRPFVLSGYYGFPHCNLDVNGPPVQPADGNPFWGNLLTFWPSSLLKRAHETFSKIVLASEDMSTDLTVRDFVRGQGGVLYYMVPSIAQHLGDKTTLRPDGRRRSPIYNDGFEA